MAHVRHHTAQGRRHAGVARDNGVHHANLSLHGAHVQRAATAEGHVSEEPRIVPLFDRHQANRTGHPGVGHRQDRLCCLKRLKTQRIGHMQPDRLEGQRTVKRAQQATTDGTRRVDATKQQIGICHGRKRIALAVAGWPWIAAGRGRSYLQHAARVDGRDRSASRAYRLDLDHRRADHQAKVNGTLLRNRRCAVGDQRHVERCSAHVACDHIREAGSLRDRSARDDAGRRPRQRRAGRQLRCGGRGHDPAAALHDQQLP